MQVEINVIKLCHGKISYYSMILLYLTAPPPILFKLLLCLFQFVYCLPASWQQPTSITGKRSTDSTVTLKYQASIELLGSYTGELPSASCAKCSILHTTVLFFKTRLAGHAPDLEIY